MAQRLKSANVPFELLVANTGVPHAFLNMKNLTNETQDAYEQVVRLILKLLNESDTAIN